MSLFNSLLLVIAGATQRELARQIRSCPFFAAR